MSPPLFFSLLPWTGGYFYFILWNLYFEIINHLPAAIFLHSGMRNSHNTLNIFNTHFVRQLLYCDKYVDQGVLGVICSEPEAGFHPSQSTEEVSWGARGAQPPFPSGQKQDLPSTFPCSANPRPERGPCSQSFSGQMLCVPHCTSCSQEPWNQDSRFTDM